jgi:hypothetical protein
LNQPFRSAVMGITMCFVLAVHPASAAYEWPLRINCGGDVLEPGVGDAYLADLPYDAELGFGYLGGESFASPIRIGVGGTSVPDLYLTARVGSFIYRFDLLEGEYVLTVRLAAVRYHGEGLGRFDILLGEQLLADSLDLSARAPRGYAQDLRFIVTSDGEPVLVRFRATLGQAEVAGIELEPFPDSLIDPAAVEGVEAWPCPGGVFLHWDAPHSEQLLGFRLWRAPGAGGEFTELVRDGSLQERHWDADVTPSAAYRYRVAPIDLLGREGPIMEVGPVAPLPLDGSRQPTFDLRIDPDSLRLMLGDPFHEHWIHARILTPQDGELAIRTRLRGDASRYQQKKSFKVKFLHGGSCAGRDVLNLVWKNDPTFLREALAASVFRWGGVSSAGVDFLHLAINGCDQGLYYRIEQIDDEYLQARGWDPDGPLIEVEAGNMTLLPDSDAYARAYARKTGNESDLSPFIELIETVNLTDPAVFPETIWDVLDVEAYLDWYALIVLMADYDITRGNHYFYRPPTGGQWHILPWDNELAFPLMLALDMPLDIGSEGSERPLPAGPNRLITRILEVEGYRRLHAMKLGLLLSEVFTEERLTVAIDSLFEAVHEDAMRDHRKSTWEDNDAFLNAVEDLRRFVGWRRSFVQEHLTEWTHPWEELRFSELCVQPDGVGFVELYNPTSVPQPLGELLLTDRPFVGAQSVWRLGEGTLAAGGCLVVGLGRRSALARAVVPLRMPADGRCLALFREEDGECELLDVVSWPAFLASGTLVQSGDPERSWSAAAWPTPGWVEESGSDFHLPGATRVVVCPQPAHGSATLLGTLEQAGECRLDICDAQGRRVRQLLDGWLPAGTFAAAWDGLTQEGRPAAQGVYFARLAGLYSVSARVIWVR